MKKSVFRMLALVLSAALVLGACTRGGGGDGGAGSTDGTGQTETVTLKVIMEEVPDTDIVMGMLDEFNQAHPNIRLDIEALPYDQMRDKIVASFLAPRATYDLIVVDNPWMYDFASAGYLEPLDDRIQQAGDAYNYEDFAKPLRDIAEVDGKVYGIPFYNYALGLIYRTDLFEEQGLQAPKTLDELMDAARKLKSGDRAGIAMTPQRGYKVFEEWGNWLFAAGGAIQDEAGNIVLDSPQAREALTKYIQTYKEAAPANSLNWAFDEALRATAGGQAAMMLSYNWMLPTLNNPDGPAGELAGKFGLAEVPGGKAVLGAWFWSIPANSNNKDAAWTFVHWLTSPEQDKQRVIAGGAPVRDSVMDDPQVHEQGFGKDYYATVKEILKDASPLGDGPGAEEMIQAVGLELSAAVSGQKSVDQAIADAAKQAREIMSK
ncbi:MAG TPA: sugar ABC transporter substrate-binding protein [Paenibacillaceae bacterium]